MSAALSTNTRRWGWVALLILTFAFQVQPAAADIFHLKRGGSVEGELLDTTDEAYKVRTRVGLVTLPVNEVARIEPSETPFAEYERRKEAVENTPAAHFKLAQWCEEEDLMGYARQHMKKALELDPDFEPARKALGFVKLNGIWVGGRHLEKRNAKEQKNAEEVDDDAEQLARAIQGRWLRYIKAIRRNLMNSQLERLQERGLKQLKEIDDPLAIFPLVEVLSQGDVNDRALLIEILAQFKEDEATMSLALMGLIDHNDHIRERAVSELVRRGDERVSAQYLDALRTGNDTIVLRAAYALGRFKHEDALPYLIDMLTAQRVKPVEVPVKSYFGAWPGYYTDRRTGVRTDGIGGIRGFTGLSLGRGNAIIGQYWEDIGRYYIAGQVDNIWRVRPVTVFRTQVLEALRAISGQNLGFEKAPWWRWYREKYGIEE
jgi:HEAT repeat protein